jgi:hypothetical protein
LISCVRDRFSSAVVQECSERGCSLDLAGLSNIVVLKGERIHSDRKMCDCVIFAEKGRRAIICVVELKSRFADAEEVVEKLGNGLKASLEILGECCKAPNPSLYPIVLAKGWRGPEHRILRSRRVELMGKRHRIILGRCGASLSRIISDC